MDSEAKTLLQLGGEESVLEVGCGPGGFLAFLRTEGHHGRLIGLDQSPAMINRAADDHSSLDIQWMIGDAGKLPFDRGTFDRLAAKHMLYHMPDLPKALQEFKRVLKPDGMALFTTNSGMSLHRINDTTNRMLAEFGFTGLLRAVDPFCCENARDLLHTTFAEVEETIIRNALIFTSHEPIVAYIGSMFPTLNIPDDPELWQEMTQWLTVDVKKKLGASGGQWRDPKVVGLYICRD